MRKQDMRVHSVITILLTVAAALAAGVFAVPFIAESLHVSEGVVGVISTFLLIPLVRYAVVITRRFVDRVMIPHASSPQEALDRIREAFSRINTIEDATNIILSATQEVIESTKSAILLWDSGRNEIVPLASAGADNFMGRIPHDSVLIKYLQREKDLLVEEKLRWAVRRETSALQRQELKNLLTMFEWLGVGVAVPLFTEKGLIGVILLGNKASGKLYQQDDIEFLGTLAQNAAIALEKTRVYQELQQSNDQLQDEVRRTVEELAIVGEQFRELDQAKSEFLSIVSHQLYASLTALRGYLSMIREGDFGNVPERQQLVYDILETSSYRLVDLIKGLLDISRIESGRLELNLESASLVDTADELVKDLMPNAVNKGLKLEFHHPTQPVPSAVVDRQRIRQVMLNFIDNAIKYTERGHIDVHVRPEGDELVFSVSDTGKGITQEEISKLFNKFTRVGGASRFHTEGTGLGLYVAKQIVKEHRGDVDVQSPGTGRGSTFSVCLPIESSPRSLKVGEKTTVEIKAAESQAQSTT